MQYRSTVIQRNMIQIIIGRQNGKRSGAFDKDLLSTFAIGREMVGSKS